MTDLREHKGVVLEALKMLREKDENYGWSLKRIGKKKAVLRWGYIPDTDISVRVMHEDEDDGSVMLECRMDDRYPNNIWEDEDELFVWVGDKHWNDAHTVDAGIRMAIGNIGYIARTRY